MRRLVVVQMGVGVLAVPLEVLGTFAEALCVIRFDVVGGADL